jgi:signal transduction histidine kinase
VLIITGDDNPLSHSAAVREGADDFLRKPILPAELQTRVRSLLRLRRLRQQLRLDVEAILELQVRQEEMVQFVMHDLKNMLGALLISVELAEEDTRGTEWRRHLLRMATGARSLQEMVSMFLDLSLADHANLTLQPEEIPARTWLHTTVGEFSNLGSRRRHPYEVTLEGLTGFRGDAHLLRRAVFNLLDNASRIAPEDSPIHIRAEAGPDGASWRLLVCDQGPGVPENMKERIFERFVQADAPASPRGGKGLGLAFCKLVAELHGGTIRVEDHQPAGSRFILDLPLG